jgi:hypothetical protein
MINNLIAPVRKAIKEIIVFSSEIISAMMTKIPPHLPAAFNQTGIIYTP